MQFPKWAAPIVLVAGLGACGQTVSDQAIIGSAAGAGTAALLNGNLLAGAAVGAAGNLLYCQQKPGACN